MSKVRYLPFAENPGLAPEFTGEATGCLPYQTVRFLGGVVLLHNPEDSGLSMQDFDMIARAAFGQTNPMISGEVYLAPSTVEAKMRKLQQERLGVLRRSMVLPAAFRLGYMSVPDIDESPNLVKAYGPRENFPVSAYSLAIISGIGRGLSMAQIGDELGKSESTIKSQLINIGDQIGFRGAETFLAAAVLTGQVDSLSCEPVLVEAMAA